MKYKRLLVSVTVLLFIVVAVFSFNFLFKISDVQLSVTYVENSTENISEKVSEYSKTLEGKNLLFLKTSDIESEIMQISPYVNVDKIEKTYPCSIKISVTELEEVFTLKANNKYYMLDTSLRILNENIVNENNVTKKPNLVIVADESDYKNLIIGSRLEFLDSVTNNYILSLTSKIKEFSENITQIEVNVLTGGVFNRTLTITTIEGMTVQFDNANVQTLEKFDFFKTWYSLQETVKDGNYFITIDKFSNEIVVRT